MAIKSNLMKRLEEIQAKAEATRKGIPYVPPTEKKEVIIINQNKNQMKSVVQIFIGFFMLAGGVLGVIALVFLASVLSGTFLWAIYPHIFAFFPNAASAGVLAPKLGWWDAVCVTWIFSILLKPASSSSSKKDDNK